tara:strand:- start:2865 stop:3605 length:741 start_codon:yes stop_codon:yes gene_type:complete
MFNYKITIEYVGTYFVGWQYQKNGDSIQETIEKALKKILKLNIKITGAGRTDKGVHATGQCANFKISKRIENKKKFLNSVNFFLKKKLISILDIKEKKLDFNARFSAKERVYEYFIINREGTLSIEKDKAWHIKHKLDLKLMKKGARILKGKHDFSAFRASSCSSNSPIKKLNAVEIKKTGNKIIILFRSRSFLQNQVRSMVGCLKYLSCNKWNLKFFKKVLASKNRELCAPPAPACGLYLKKISY